MSLEAGVVVAKDGSVIHWHLPASRSAGFLPDSRTLWDVLWQLKDRLGGFAHSHPGRGVPAPSGTDLSTFEAVEASLGFAIDWWITSRDSLILVRRMPFNSSFALREVSDLPPWLYELRRLSYEV